MTDEELIARLREGCSCNIDSTPCMAEEECRDAFAAADRIAELLAKNDNLFDLAATEHSRAERLEAALRNIAESNYIGRAEGYARAALEPVTPAPDAAAMVDPACDHCGMDPAAIREAALREAAAVVEREIEQAKRLMPMVVPILRSVHRDILALLEKPHDH